MRRKIGHPFVAFKEAAKVLVANDVLRMAGATAFFAMFALPPMQMIIVSTFGFFGSKRKFAGQILNKVSNVLGADVSEQIRDVINGVRRLQLSVLATALIFAALLFVATTLFTVIKNSINQIWRIRGEKKRHYFSMLLFRLKATGFILFTGTLFLAVMGVEFVQAYVGLAVPNVSQVVTPNIHGLLNHIVSVTVVAAWFLVLYRFLPDGRPRFGINLAGALVSALLFSGGKYLLRRLLSGNVQHIYGTSGALVVILLFVFYSSLILYYGAAFIRTLGLQYNMEIKPLPHATGYEVKESDTPDKPRDKQPLS